MSPIYSALDAVSTGVYTALNVAAVTTLATGGIGDDIAQGTVYSFVLYTVRDKPIDAMGTQPGRSGFLSELSIRLNVYTQYQGAKQGQLIADASIGALLTAFDPASPTVSIVGYKVCQLRWDNTTEPFDSEVAGLKVKETVVDMTMRLELQ